MVDFDEAAVVARIVAVQVDGLAVRRDAALIDSDVRVISGVVAPLLIGGG